MSPLRILIVDDSAPVRRALRSFLSREHGCEVCGEAEDGAQAVAAARRLRPGVIIMDVMMPVCNGLDACRAITREIPDVAVLLYTTHDLPELHALAGKAGARRCLTKVASPESLIEALRRLTAAAGQR